MSDHLRGITDRPLVSEIIVNSEDNVKSFTKRSNFIDNRDVKSVSGKRRGDPFSPIQVEKQLCKELKEPNQQQNDP